MTEEIITDNSVEIIRIKWDGQRFVLIWENKRGGIEYRVAVIILNPKEMLDVIEFAGKLGGK